MALVLENISKQVNRRVHLYPIDVEFERGSFNVLVGRTRAGKTSLLRIIAGLDRPSSGTVQLNGRDLAKLPIRKRPVAMVYQEFINYPSLSVFENIASPLRRQKAKNIDRRVRELADMLGIGDLLDRLPGHISGGQQQRVAIARALAKGAEILLLDEPLVNLDYKLREQLRDELRNILRDGDTTVLYATSEPSEALAFGGCTVVMHEGRVVQSAPALDVYRSPASVAAASVFSDPPMNLFPVKVSGGVARFVSPGADDAPCELSLAGRGGLAELDDGTYRFGVRAGECALNPRGEDELALPCVVQLVEISGSESYVHLGYGDTHVIVEETRMFQHALGEACTLYVDPRRFLVFGADDRGALIARSGE